MSLERLADEIIRIANTGRSTPVIVTPSYLSFRPLFFSQFTTLLASRTDRPVRIDWQRGDSFWNRGIGSAIGDRIAGRKAGKITRMMDQIRPGTSIQVTESIGRPSRQTGIESGGSESSELVIGLCHTGQPLPAWATPIKLGDRPDST